MFSDSFDNELIQDGVSRSLLASEAQVQRCLGKNRWTVSDLPVLLSPAMSLYLEALAQRSVMITRQRFGNAMQLFVPLYLSNECYNTCTYCGFSQEYQYKRTTLTDEQIIAEGKLLSDKGFDHVLLLTGESPKTVGLDYIAHAVGLLRPYFSSLGIEVQPMKVSDYRHLIACGVDALTLYQETYHLETYKKVHLSGLKRQYRKRLDAVDYGAEAGFFKINVGALLGLYDWRYDCLALAQHVQYLKQQYWKVKLGVSFPRIQDMFGDFNVDYPVSDSQLVQVVCAFRGIFPDLGITLSTRESAAFRDAVVSLGITTVSAESNTAPGGYTSCESVEQFSIHDTRCLDEVCSMLKEKGLDPVFKDWDMAYINEG